MRLPSSRKTIALAGGLLCLAAYASLAILVYRSQADPERLGALDGAFGWILGPPAAALQEAADRRIRDAMTALEDKSLPPDARRARYREHLAAAEKLLVRGLRASPAQARALSQLAAIRWGLYPPRSEEDVRKHLDMIAAASRMAPRVPDVQMRLGTLLLRMGRQGESIAYLRHTVEMEPSRAAAVVKLLRDQMLPAEEITAALPALPETRIALLDAYFEDGKGSEYLDLLESSLEPASPDVLASYGWACLRAGDPDRLRARLDRLGPSADPRLEAERLRQSSRALLALEDSTGAIEEARRARALQPDDATFSGNLGEIALASGRAQDAIAAFEEALALVARASGDPPWRAFLHSQIGQAEERRGRPDRAYDAYRKALEIDPAEAFARRRIAEMEKAAGRQPR